MMDDPSTTSKPPSSAFKTPTPDTKSTVPRILYSAKLGDQRGSAAPAPTRQPPAQQKAWAPAKIPSTSRPNMVNQNKVPKTLANGANKTQQANMTSLQRKDVTSVRVVADNAGSMNTKASNGSRFRIDGAISNAGPGKERVLQPWVPDSSTIKQADLSLEGNVNGQKWDQFRANEIKFGVKTDYAEEIYTTPLDRNTSQYQARFAAADRIAREIEGSSATTAHVAEERIMDFAGGADKTAGDEEDKYSGVRRQEFPPLASRENKYTPPARRAPTARATVKGAPVDPAIISAQIKGAPIPKQFTQRTEETKGPVPGKGISPLSVQERCKGNIKSTANTSSGMTTALTKPERSAAGLSRMTMPEGKEGRVIPSVTADIEHQVLTSFKGFANKERTQAEKIRTTKARQDKELKLEELRKFASTFKLSTPVPKDLVSIIAKDPQKQKEIQAKAERDAAELQLRKKTVEEAARRGKDVGAKEAAVPPKEAVPTSDAATASASASAEPRGSVRPVAPQGTNKANNLPTRHQAAVRPTYSSSQAHFMPFPRNNRAPAHLAAQHQPIGNLAHRIRSMDGQKMQPVPVPHGHGPDVRLPPTGPANRMPPPFMPKLNPSTAEFRPHWIGPSQASSPRSAANHMVMEPCPPGQLIRRKTKAVDVKKCYILGHMQTIKPPPGKKWDDNGDLRPAYDTPPTWRQAQAQAEDGEKAGSNMLLTYTEYFERMPPAQQTVMLTPNPPPHALPTPHQHQLPLYLQGPSNMGPRQSPHMSPMPLGAHPGPGPHPAFNGPDDHRMMHSNSAQSFASPRLQHGQVAYPAMNIPGPLPYNQPAMHYMSPGTPHMAPFRSFSNNPPFMGQQHSHMVPMMGQPHFITGPNGMVGGHPMHMYAGGHAQAMPPGAAPPPPMPSANGYPSPGRPAAPMMIHQGSHQGQQGYAMSPAMSYQQPAYNLPPQQPQGKFSGQRPQ